MSDFRWELRRRDGEVLDRAHRLAWLLRAAGTVLGAAGAPKGRTYKIVHAPTGTVVGLRSRAIVTIDRELVAVLEPGEA